MQSKSMLGTDSAMELATQASRKAFIYVGVFSFFVNILMLTVPIYMLQLFDRVLASRSYDTLIYLTIIAIFALLTFALLDIARSRILIQVSHWLDNFLSPQALSKSADELLQGRLYGSQSLRDITSLRQFLGSPSIFSIFDSPWVPMYLLVIFLLHPLLGILATIGAVILFVMALINELVTSAPLAEANSLAMKTQAQTDSTMRNAEVIQAMGMMPNLVRRWYEENEKSITLQCYASRLSGTILSISKFARLSLQLLMLGTGAYLVVQNQITPGAMIAGSILLSRALAPVEQAIGTWKQMLSARQSYNRLLLHFSTPSARASGIQLPTPKGHVEVKGAYYVPPNMQKPVISNINMDIQVGEMVAMIGPAAAGKSTLARLLVGAIQANSGSVRLDGANVYTWDRVDFGKYLGYLPQDVELFTGTVKDNIARMGKPDEKAIIEAAKLADVHEMILQLPNGYETEITAENFTLSGGQRQRIALARALYKNPKVLVLDEPNSNLDGEGELALMRALETMRSKGSTIIVIAHRPSLLKIVDKIVVLNQGQIQFSGPRDEILSKINQLSSQQIKQSSNFKFTHSAGDSHAAE